jgi:hypothetical protein
MPLHLEPCLEHLPRITTGLGSNPQSGLLGGAAAWPMAAWAQQTDRVPRIGLLMPSANDAVGQTWRKRFRAKLGMDELIVAAEAERRKQHEGAPHETPVPIKLSMIARLRYRRLITRRSLKPARCIKHGTRAAPQQLTNGRSRAARTRRRSAV